MHTMAKHAGMTFLNGQIGDPQMTGMPEEV
jgi:hypothetical protein